MATAERVARALGAAVFLFAGFGCAVGTDDDISRHEGSGAGAGGTGAGAAASAEVGGTSSSGATAGAAGGAGATGGTTATGGVGGSGGTGVGATGAVAGTGGGEPVPPAPPPVAVTPTFPIDVPPTEQWLWVPIEGTECADGTQAGVGVNFTTKSRELLIWFQGNGACYNLTSCTMFANLLTGMGPDPLNHLWWGDPNTSHIGVFNRSDPGNPWRASNYIAFPHCAVDGHSADKESTPSTTPRRCLASRSTWRPGRRKRGT